MNNIKGLTKKEKMAIDEYKDLLLKKFNRRISRIVLFGSKARGDSSRSSDVDLLVVITDDGKHIRQEIASLTHEPIIHFEVLLSPIIVKESFFEVWSPLLEHIREEGVTVWTSKRAKESM